MGKLTFGWLGVVAYILCLPITHVFAYNDYLNLSTISVGILIITNWRKIRLPLRIEYKFLYLTLLVSLVPFLLNRPDYEKSVIHYFAFLGSILFFFIAPSVILTKYPLESIEGIVKLAIYLSILLAFSEFLAMVFFQYQLNLPRPNDNYYDPPLFMIDDYRVIRVRGWSVESGHFATSILFLSLPFLFNKKNNSKKISILLFINILITNGMSAFAIYCINILLIFLARLKRLRNSHKILGIIVFICLAYFAIEKILEKASDSSSGDRINRIISAWNYVQGDISFLLFGLGPGMLDDVGVKGSVVSFFGVLVFEYGILIFLLFIMFLMTAFVKKSSMENKIFIISFILNAVFISNFWYPFFWYPLILLTLYRVKN
jgi:hypothetical protein